MGKKTKQTDAVAAVIKKVTGKTAPYQRLAIDAVEPNDWNPNKLNDENRTKLWRGMKHLLDQGVPLPPIVVRPHPSKPDMFQIIDGFHRWDILRVEELETVDAYVINVDTKTAMLLTDALNYLRGEPDPESHAQYLHRLITEHELPPSEAAEYLPYTASEIETHLDNYDLKVEHIEPPPLPGNEDENPQDSDDFLILKFAVSREQAEVIERELSRIGSLYKGKNIRGRALEFMAVNSSQTELGNLTGEMNEPLKFSPSGKKIKAKLREVARGS